MQLGWSLQTGKLDAVYSSFGAKSDQFPMLWVAAPLAGLLVQPVVGWLSDHTGGRLGRRRPYLLASAILGALALAFLPQTSNLWLAAGWLWVLDASANLGLPMFRAFAADRLSDSQQTRGYAMQSVFLCLGAALSQVLPRLFSSVFGGTDPGVTPGVVSTAGKWALSVGALVLLGSVLWTVFTTREDPPDDPDEFRRQRAKHFGLAAGVKNIADAVREMPDTMRRLAGVQLCTWLGLFCLRLSFIPAVARSVMGAVEDRSVLYAAGVAWGNELFAVGMVAAFFAAVGLVVAGRRTGPRVLYTVCLLCGAAGMLSMGLIHNKYYLLASVVGMGVAWAGVLSMPYALLAPALPPGRTGVYMGIFHAFVALPGIVAALCFGWIVKNLLGNDHVMAVVSGGALLLLAAVPAPDRAQPRRADHRPRGRGRTGPGDRRIRPARLTAPADSATPLIARCSAPPPGPPAWSSIPASPSRTGSARRTTLPSRPLPGSAWAT